MKSIGRYILMAIAGCCLWACNPSDKSPNGDIKIEKLTVLCDDGCYEMFSKVVADYDSINYSATFDLKRTPAFDCMANLLAGKAKAVIVSREFSQYEDSLMKVYKVEPYEGVQIAHDALVFYVKSDAKIDSLTDGQLKDVFTNTGASVQKYYPASGITEFACNSQLSSEYFYLKKYILKDNKSAVKLKEFSTQDSVVNYVSNNKNAIGIGFLSQLHGKGEVRALPISFNDSLGNYIFPHVVHQANIVRGFYPYKITHYIYVFDKSKDVPMALTRFLSKSAKGQRFFNEYGIVPAFARIKLTIEE